VISFYRLLKIFSSSSYGKIVRGISVGLFISLVVIIFYKFSLFEPFELKTLDWRFKMLSSPEEASSEIVIVVVDQKSLDYYERMQSIPWPWPRSLYQPVIDLVALGGARALIFDILFTERSGYGYEDDEYFEEVVKNRGNVYMPIFMSRKERQLDPALEQLLVSERTLPVDDESEVVWETYRSVVLPLDGLVSGARGLGNVMMNPDGDGVYRRVPLLFKYREKFFPSLPLSVVKDILDVKRLSIDTANRLHMDGMTVPLQEDGTVLVKYYGGAATYRYYSIASLIESWVRLEEGAEPIVGPEEFRDKVVLVGLTAPGLFDLKPTPLSSVYPGVEVHATVIDNILREDFLRRVGTFTVLLYMLVLNLICGVVASYFVKLKALVPLVCCCMAAPFLLALGSFNSDLWLDLVSPEIGVVLTFVLTSIISYSTEGRQRRFIKSAFTHYLSPPVIDELVRNPERLKLGGERRELTVFFSDIEGFTTLSEKLAPEQLSELLCEYLSRMTDVILSYGGTLDKYEGDAIMAFWGAPLSQLDHAQRACFTALECQATLAEIRREFSSRGWPLLHARVGLNSGEMVVGNMGSRERFDYTVLGDNVNLGSRLEGANKQFGTRVMISENTWQLAKEEVEVRELDMIRVKGKETPVRVYELLAKRGQLTETKAKSVEVFGKGLALYRNRKWKEAIEFFSKLPDDPPSVVFRKRCTELLRSPPPENWDGVYTMSSK
jgi:adenylate cyclase